MGLKEKLKRELGYMRLGAKVMGKKAGQVVKARIEEERQRQREQASIRAEYKKLEETAYKKEMKRQAVIAGQRRARGLPAKPSGWRGTLQKAGAIGESLQLDDMLGFSDLAGKKKKKK